MIHQRKNRGHRTSKIVKSRKSYRMAICPIICSFYYLARALMHDVASEIACAEGCAETISTKVLKHGAILYNEAEVFSLSITIPNGESTLPFDWLIYSDLILAHSSCREI